MILTTPNILVDNIVMQADANNASGVNSLLNVLINIPIIKIGEYVLNLGDIEELTLTYRPNSFPEFQMTLNDEQYIIRSALKNDIDKCVVFLGFKDWYIKFNGLLNTSFTEAGDSIIELTGQVFNPLLYNRNQLSYNNIPLQEIFTDICNKTKQGLFTDSNSNILSRYNYIINPNDTYLKFIRDTIEQYTDNVYMFDWFYYLHIVDIDNLRNREIDTYSRDFYSGKQMETEMPIIFKTAGNVAGENDGKIPVKYYSIDTNYSLIHSKTAKEYSVASVNNNIILPSNDMIGIGNANANTFSGFLNDKKSFYHERINKKMAGNIIKIFLDRPMLELLPFSVVFFECYLPRTNNNDIDRNDEEHSGKKILISNSIKYKKKEKSDASDVSTTTQTLELI